MSKKHINIRGNGMKSKEWGPRLWFVIHTFALGYPKNPSKKIQKEYKQFYMSIKYTLPCAVCRQGYAKFVKELPLTAAVLKDRNSLFKWTVKIHNKVNKKLNKKHKTIKNARNYYEKFRVKD